MKNQIKKLAYGGAALAMTLPALVMAQSSTYGTFNPPKDNLPSASILGIIENVMRWLLTAVGFIGIIGFAIAGILYLTAAGDDDRIKQAKNAMTYSIVGVIVALAGYVALRAAHTFLDAGKF